MNLKRFFVAPAHSTFTDVALLLLRFVAGLAFMFHGWDKIRQPFSWMGPDAAIPGIFQALAALAEFGGGLFWILGALTALASFGIACTMVVAVYFHAVIKGDPFVSTGGGSYELALVYLVIAILFIATGPGRFSVDNKLFKS
ncbi:MAG: DoxX family protein [Acidobacteriota bacterium]|nr:DoxX family protein [Acidobacteriota bacterium]